MGETIEVIEVVRAIRLAARIEMRDAAVRHATRRVDGAPHGCPCAACATPFWRTRCERARLIVAAICASNSAATEVFAAVRRYAPRRTAYSLRQAVAALSAEHGHDPRVQRAARVYDRAERMTLADRPPHVAWDA